MGLGFQLAESLSGSYYRLDDSLKDHAIRVTLRIGVNGLRRFVRERKLEARGALFAEGLAERDPDGVAVEGTLAMRLFDERRVPYDLSFVGDDGQPYRLRGQRDFFVHDAIDSLTMLPVSLFAIAPGGDREVGRALLRFDPKTELRPFLKSFRPKVRVSRYASGLD